MSSIVKNKIKEDTRKLKISSAPGKFAIIVKGISVQSQNIINFIFHREWNRHFSIFHEWMVNAEQ